MAQRGMTLIELLVVVAAIGGAAAGASLGAASGGWLGFVLGVPAGFLAGLFGMALTLGILTIPCSLLDAWIGARHDQALLANFGDYQHESRRGQWVDLPLRPGQLVLGRLVGRTHLKHTAIVDIGVGFPGTIEHALRDDEQDFKQVDWSRPRLLQVVRFDAGRREIELAVRPRVWLWFRGERVGFLDLDRCPTPREVDLGARRLPAELMGDPWRFEIVEYVAGRELIDNLRDGPVRCELERNEVFWPLVVSGRWLRTSGQGQVEVEICPQGEPEPAPAATSFGTPRSSC